MFIRAMSIRLYFTTKKHDSPKDELEKVVPIPWQIYKGRTAVYSRSEALNWCCVSLIVSENLSAYDIYCICMHKQYQTSR